MSRIIYTYALIKSLYDQGEDYIDSFWPFAVMVIPERKFSSIGFIKHNLNLQYDLEIPYHVLEAILDRAMIIGCLEKKRWKKKYKITPKGAKYREKLETEKEVSRKIESLIEDVKYFFEEHSILQNSERIRSLILTFLKRNIVPLIEFMKPTNVSDKVEFQRMSGEEEILVEYIKVAEHQKPEHYKTLEKMILGSIISVILFAEEPSDIFEIGKRKFKQCQVFLDTNFVFSLLELHEKEFNKPAKELFDLLKKNGFNIKIFDFTVDEICKVIKDYGQVAHRYPRNISVGGTYGTLSRKKWTKTDAVNFITNIEKALQQKGIEIEQTNVDLKFYEPLDDNIRVQITRFKREISSYTINHDTAAIEKIKELRVKSSRKIEDSEAFFLTSDFKLSTLNFREMGHREKGTICEVILDKLLAIILWLKNPNSTPPLKLIMAAYSRDLFIRREIWNKFYETVDKMKKDGKISEEDISALFYQNYIEDVLKEYDETEICEITEEFVLEEVEKALKFPEEEVKRRIENIKREIEEGLRKAARDSAKKLTWILRSLIVLLSIFSVGYCIFARKLDTLLIICGIFGFVIVIAGVAIGPIERIWLRVEDKMARKLYDAKKKDARLDEIAYI